jgi:hypothetical protein
MRAEAGAEIVTAPDQSGRTVGVDLVSAFRAEPRPLGGVPGGRWSGEAGYGWVCRRLPSTVTLAGVRVPGL